MKLSFIPISLLFLFSACHENMEDNISKYIDSQCEKEPCIIKMNNLTSFKWDKMYVFDCYVPEVVIRSTIKDSLPYLDPLTNKYIFLLRNKIVHIEEINIKTKYADVDPIRDNIKYNSVDTLNFFVCNHYDSCRVDKYLDKHGKYYIITLLN